MKRILFMLMAVTIMMLQPAWATDYNYISAEELNSQLGSGRSMLIVDIQVKKEFAEHHIKGSVETNAYPVKSDKERETLNPVITQYNSGKYESFIVVCPRGKGGAKRAYDYLKEQGIPEQNLFILTGGMAKWPYEKWVE